MRAMSLDASGKVEEDNELNHVKSKLELTTNLVLNLSKQLEEIKESVIIIFNFWEELFLKLNKSLLIFKYSYQTRGKMTNA